MKEFTRNVKWSVSLSDGSTFHEGKKPFELFEGELSPWLRLQQYLKDNDLHITSLSLYTDDARTFNLPSIGKNPKFRAFSNLERPQQYIYERIMAKDIEPNSRPELFVIIKAIYKTHSLELWVSEDMPSNMWVLSYIK